MITTILSFLAKGTLFLLKSIVILCGVGAVVFVMLFILKFIVGVLAKMLGVNGSSGGGSGAVGGLLNTVNRGINGIFSGIGTVFNGVTKGTGTVFNGVANTAGMTRDKMLGANNHNYNKRNNNYNNYNNDYDYMNEKRNRRGRRRNYNQDYYNDYNQQYNDNLYSQQPISNKVGDPNDPTDQYFTAKRYYDEDGFDQFGFNKDGKHKDEVMKELLDKKKKEKSNKISDLYQDKEFSDSEVANQWIKDARFKKPSTWMYGAVGLTYAAAHGIGKALNKDVPDDWEDLENKDSGIQKTVDMTQEDINMAEERKDNAPDGGITAEELVNQSEFVKDSDVADNNIYSEDSILEEIENHKMKEKVPAYTGMEEEKHDKELVVEESSNSLTWESNEDSIIDLDNNVDEDGPTIEQVDLNANFTDDDLDILGDLEENIHNKNNKPEEEDWFAKSDSKIKEL